MAYDEGIAEHAREMFDQLSIHVQEKKMFGGLCFMLNGNMLCGIVGSEMMFRVGKDQYEECLSKKSTREMDFTGKKMKGMVYVNTEGVANEIEQWINYSINFVGELPEK